MMCILSSSKIYRLIFDKSILIKFVVILLTLDFVPITFVIALTMVDGDMMGNPKRRLRDSSIECYHLRAIFGFTWQLHPRGEGGGGEMIINQFSIS
jgi:hypothetical protein